MDADLVLDVAAALERMAREDPRSRGADSGREGIGREDRVPDDHRLCLGPE